MTTTPSPAAAAPAPLSPPPRVIIGTYALDQHEVAALMVSRVLRDAGADVIYLGRFNLPEHFVEAAVQEDADVIGISCHSWEYLELTGDLLARVEALDRDVSVVLGGSVITDTDTAGLLEQGVAAVIGPSAPEAEFVEAVWRAAARARGVTPAPGSPAPAS
ncbi:cobalamin B12-binding domain-containing protein [Tomitella fengzijianii]|uniref:cobalamin B12-binding domain-containing protein n=1 Tax=Tomitella fengzijianii TaxID=2597660 RepID=UPI00131BE6AE|nr:cobalamin-dependent protein [Tomitella fengzijianii]